jgi:hypothetical protein
MTPGEFAAKWRGVETSERASAQSHFLDLCALLGEPGPTQADPTGAWYAFEKGAEKLDGHDGFADVWKKGYFAWEYCGSRPEPIATRWQHRGHPLRTSGSATEGRSGASPPPRTVAPTTIAAPISTTFLMMY